MAEYGEWSRQGASLSDVTAKKEYGVERNFILKGIQDGKLEYQEGTIWGNPYLKLLRRQLEHYIDEELGTTFLLNAKKQTELAKIKKEITSLQKQLKKLQEEKTELEKQMKA